MPNPETVVMLLAAGIGLWVCWTVGWLVSVAAITWLHDGHEWAAKNYPPEELERLRRFGL